MYIGIEIGGTKLQLGLGHGDGRSEEHTSELQSHSDVVCRLRLEKKKRALLRQTTRCMACRSAGCVGSRLAQGDLREDYREIPGRRFDGLLFFFNDTATTEIYTLSLHDALPI